MATPVPQDDLPTGVSSSVVPEHDLPTEIKTKMAMSKAESYARDVASDILKYGLGGIPFGGLQRGIKTMGEVADKAAYKGGEAVTDIASKMGAKPEVAGGLGFATNVGIQAVPMFLGGEAAEAATPAIERMARKLMQSALKPSKVELETGKAAKAIDTMLNEGFNVTPGGVEKLRARISILNDQVADAIKNSTATIDKNSVAQRLQEAYAKFEKQVTPQSDLATIKKAFDEFINNPILAKFVPEKTVASAVLDASGVPFEKVIPASGSEKIPVQLAQEVKQGTYRALGSKTFGELKGAEIEAQKALARGLKEEIAKKVPGISQLNAKESELLNAESIASARALMDANKNPMGLGWLAMHPTSWIGFAADRSPFIKSLMARALHTAPDEVGLRVPGQIMGATVGPVIGLPNSGSSFSGMLNSTQQGGNQ